MVKGTIDGGVRDQQHGGRILDAVMPLLPSGAVVRVTTKLVKVDMSRVRRYTLREADTEGDGDVTVTGSPS